MQSQTFKLLLLALGVGACSGEAEESMEELGTVEQAITTTLDFQDTTTIGGYKGTRDARLVSGTPTTNYGTSRSCLIAPGQSGNEQSCVILFFDLGDYIPASAIIQSATLFLNITDPSPNGFSVHTLLRHWKESEVTWNNAGPLEPWGTPGAKSASDRGTLVTLVSTPNTGVVSINLGATGVAKIQEAINMGDSVVNGFILSNWLTGDGIGFDTSEALVKANRPKLRVTFVN